MYIKPLTVLEHRVEDPVLGLWVGMGCLTVLLGLGARALLIPSWSAGSTVSTGIGSVG